MNIASMINLYSAKTDEEVLALASQMDQFTVEAQAVLASELTRRRIAVDLEPSKTGEITKQALSRPKTGEFVEETLRCYHRNRWSFLEVALSAVLLSFLAIQFSRMEVRHLTRHVDLLSGPPSRFLLPEAMLISISGFFVSWMVFCLAFGAICLAVEQEHAGYQISMGGAFEAIFERLGSFMGISALLFGLFFALETFALDRVTLWATPWIESRFGHLSPLTWTLIGAGGYVAVSFIIAHPFRFALQINCRRVRRCNAAVLGCSRDPTDSQSALVVSMDTLCSFNCVRERGRTGHVHRLFLAVFEEDRSCKH